MKVESNIDGFVWLTGADLAEMLVGSGVMTREQADRALARRAELIAARKVTTASTGGVE